VAELSKTGKAALGYARRGWQVFPVHSLDGPSCTCNKESDCSHPGKHPLWHEADLANGLLNATVDLSLIRRWWERWPWANVGIRTGTPSGIVVIDVDKKAGGLETWEDLQDIHGRVDTLTSRTGGGGLHLVFTYQDSRLKSDDNVLGDGVDVKAEGGYIIAPPSTHASGEEYRWEDKMQPAPLYDWAYEKWPKHEPSKTEHNNNGGDDPWVSEALLNGASLHTRNKTATRLAGYLHHKGHPKDIILSMLMQFGERCDPAMDIRELQRTVESVTRYERTVALTQVLDPPEYQEEGDTQTYSWAGVTIQLDQLRQERDGLHCEIMVEAASPGMAPLVHGPVRFNLVSTQARGTLERYLKGRIELDWGGMLDSVSKLAIAQHREGEPVIDLSEYQAGDGDIWTLKPFIVEGEISIIFGDGGTGKSLLSLATAATVMGKDILGSILPSNYKALYLDWETNAATHTRRLKAITQDSPRVGYLACHVPLLDMIRQIKRQILEGQYNLIVIDSVGAACGGEPEKTGSALTFCNAIRGLNVTSLLIGHQTKENDKSQKPFGSTFWHNAARSTLEVRQQRDPGENTIHVGLYHRKMNDGMLEKPSGYAIKFEDSQIVFQPEDLMSIPDLAKGTPLIDQISSALHDKGAMTVAQLADELGAKEGSVKTTCYRHEDKRLIKLEDNLWDVKYKHL